MYVTGPGLSTALAATLFALPERSDTALRSMPVPSVRTAAAWPFPGQHALDVLQQLERLNQAIRSLRYSDRTLGVLTQRETGNAEIRRFFLHAAGVRDGRGAATHERHELHVAQRLGEMDGTGCAQALQQAEFLELLARARMHGEDHRQARCCPEQLLDQRRQRL